MEVLSFLLVFVVTTFFVAGSLWLGAKIVKVECTFLAMLIIAAVTMLLYMIPGVGWILSLVALYFMLHKWTTAEFWPDAVIMVVVAWAIRFVVGLGLALVIGAMQTSDTAI
jgi:hypothetical protein